MVDTFERTPTGSDAEAAAAAAAAEPCAWPAAADTGPVGGRKATVAVEAGRTAPAPGPNDSAVAVAVADEGADAGARKAMVAVGAVRPA